MTTMEENMDVSQNLNLKLAHNTGTILLRIYSKKLKTQNWTDNLYTHIHGSDVQNS